MRLFIGAPAPPSGRFRKITEELAADASGVRPVPAGSWHVTLRFLGEVEEAAAVAGRLEAALGDAAAVPCRVAGVGAFQSPQRARVVWAGVEAPGLEAIERRVQEATAGLGRPPERREFVPHVTLARLAKPRNLSTFIRRHAETPFCQGVLDSVVLYRSDLSPQGPAYTREATIALADGGGLRSPGERSGAVGGR